MDKEILKIADRLHTTEMGAKRIGRNLSVDCNDVVAYCRTLVVSPDAVCERKGKNLYVTADGVVVTVNAGSFTVITAHRQKRPAAEKGKG